jgi:hypothetical protein
LGQKQKHRLKGILGILILHCESATNVENRRPMAADNKCEGRLVVAKKLCEKFAIRGGVGFNTSENLHRSRFGHVASLPELVPARPPARRATQSFGDIFCS